MLILYYIISNIYNLFFQSCRVSLARSAFLALLLLQAAHPAFPSSVTSEILYLTPIFHISMPYASISSLPTFVPPAHRSHNLSRTEVPQWPPSGGKAV